MAEGNDNYNRGGLLAFGFCMAFVFSFFIYLVFINQGVDLAENVKDPNAQVAGEAEFNMDSVTEPWVKNEKVATYGQKVYKANCAICHGDAGKGDGAGGAALNPKPRNFIEGKWTQGNGVTDHFKVVANGIAGSSMAPFGHLKLSDRWAVVQYIESITQNKSKETDAQVAEFAKTAK
jgi:mono/diheme cytochrome c family protein